MKPFLPAVESRASASPTVSSCKFRGYSRFHRGNFCTLQSFLFYCPALPRAPHPPICTSRFRSLSTLVSNENASREQNAGARTQKIDKRTRSLLSIKINRLIRIARDICFSDRINDNRDSWQLLISRIKLIVLQFVKLILLSVKNRQSIWVCMTERYSFQWPNRW